MIIAIDCDEVLKPYAQYAIPEYNRLYGTNIRIEESYSRDAYTGAGREEVLRRFASIHRSPMMASVAPFEEALDSVRRLAKEHDLYIVTAREKELRDTTQEMAMKYFPGMFKDVVCAGDENEKGDICLKINADALIDDGLWNLESAHRHGITNLLWYGDYVWHDYSRYDDNHKAIRCLSWHEVEQEIERIANS